MPVGENAGLFAKKAALVALAVALDTWITIGIVWMAHTILDDTRTLLVVIAIRAGLAWLIAFSIFIDPLSRDQPGS